MSAPRSLDALCVVGKGYYGDEQTVEPIYLYFTETLRELGHTVHHFDHVLEAERLGPSGAAEALDRRLRELQPQLVLVQHFHPAPGRMTTDVFRAWKDRSCVIAWNSDDDWQWSMTLPQAPAFTWMVTTYPSVHRVHRTAIPNLLLSQWGCFPRFADFDRAKDIDFSFAGQAHPTRMRNLSALRRQAGLQVYGKGARMVRLGIPPFRGMQRLPLLLGPAIDFARINEIWNRTRVSYTPLEGGPRGEVLSLKSRIFDQGLSGTVMLCQHAPDLERYYEPGREVVTFVDLDDCVEQAERVLRDEPTRLAIAARYRDRTQAEHLWRHRMVALLADAGVA